MPRNAAKKRAPGGRRLSKIEVLERVRFVESLLAQHATRQQVLDECAAKWCMPARTADDYIRRVRDAWTESARVDRRDIRLAAKSRLLILGRQLREAAAWGALVSVERMLLDIDGIREPLPEDFSHEQLPIEEFTLEDLFDQQLSIAGMIGKLNRKQDPKKKDRVRAALKESLKQLDRPLPASLAKSLGDKLPAWAEPRSPEA